jgi:hypothetical protein
MLLASHAAKNLTISQSGPGWSRRHSVHRDVATAQLVRQHRNEAFDSGLGGDIAPVCGEGLREYAAGEGDDAASLGDALRRLREDEEGFPAGWWR